MSAALVKELRERTGLGLLECKKALAEADGDIEAAIEALRKSSGNEGREKGGPDSGRWRGGDSNRSRRQFRCHGRSE